MTTTRLLLVVGLVLAGVGLTALGLSQPLVAVITLWLAAFSLFMGAWAGIPRDDARDWRDDDDH